MKCRVLILAMLLAVLAPLQHAGQFRFPIQHDSVRFAVIGDMGTGKRPQYQTAEEMTGNIRIEEYES